MSQVDKVLVLVAYTHRDYGLSVHVSDPSKVEVFEWDEDVVDDYKEGTYGGVEEALERLPEMPEAFARVFPEEAREYNIQRLKFMKTAEADAERQRLELERAADEERRRKALALFYGLPTAELERLATGLQESQPPSS